MTFVNNSGLKYIEATIFTHAGCLQLQVVPVHKYGTTTSFFFCEQAFTLQGAYTYIHPFGNTYTITKKILWEHVFRISHFFQKIVKVGFALI